MQWKGRERLSAATETTMRNDRQTSATLHPPSVHGLWKVVADMVAELRRGLASGYRPERHYMRGPGPAWHAKHAGA
jgi:hypothetical protein